jgi:hypothetical protein
VIRTGRKRPGSPADSGARVDRLQVVHSAFCLSPSIDPAGRQLTPAAAASRTGAKSHARRACLLLPRGLAACPAGCPAPTTHHVARIRIAPRARGSRRSAFRSTRRHTDTQAAGGAYGAHRIFFRDPAGARRRLRACACGWLKWKARYRARAEHKPTWCSLSCAAVRWCRAVPPGRYRRPGRCRRLVTHHVPSSVPGVVVYGVLLLPVQIHRGLCRCRERIMQVQPCTEFVRFACALIITARHFVNPWLYQNA